MTARPWMPIYWGDYLADTAHFTNAEHGAYLLLIAFYWTNGKLPDDEEAIRRIAKATAHQWKKMRPVLVEKFSPNWKHKRIDTELAKSLEKSRTNAANAKRRHSERTANAQRSDTQPQPQPQKKKEVPAARAAPDPILEIEPVNEPPKAKLFRKGKTILVSMGLSENRSGSVIGGWLKKRDDPEGILAALEYARDQCVVEPVGYVTRLLSEKGHSNGKHQQQSLSDRALELAAEARELERQAGIVRSPAA